MRGIIFERAGEPKDVLALKDVPVPKPDVGEALVKVTARPIQPADLAFVRGQYRLRPRLPQVAGLEGAGVVVSPADGASQIPAPSTSQPLPPGTRVAFRVPATWAEFVAVPADRLIEIPSQIPDDVACQMSLNPITAWALLDLARLVAGDTLILTAANSTVSRLVAAIARRRGVRVIGVVRSAAHAAIRSAARNAVPEADARAGADFALSADDPDLAEHIKDHTGGKGAAALLDSVGGPLVAKLLAALAAGARIVAYGVQDPQPIPVTNAMLVYSNLTWIGFGIDRWLSGRTVEQRRAMLQDLWALVADDTVRLPVASRHRLGDIAAALAADAQPGRLGKVLLV
jgi:NADPH2:quinone reductase